MSGHLVTGKRDRRRHISTLRGMVTNFTAASAGHEEEEQTAQAELWWQRAIAIRWALGFVAQHVNLETGELTISLELAEETV